MRVAADGAHAAQRRAADAAVKPRVGAPAGELASDAQAGIGGGRLVAVEQLFGLGVAREGQELAFDLEFRRGAGDGGGVDDLLQGGQRLRALLGLDVAQVDLALARAAPWC